MTPVVIDLSHHNTIPKDLKAAYASGIVGCIHKLTEGSSYTDDKVAARYALAKDAGMAWGLYHFIRPGDPAKQAQFFYDRSLTVSDEDTLYALDWEDSAVPADDALAFLIEIEELTGRAPVLYSGHVCKEDPLAGLSAYRLWLAQYGSSCTLPDFADEYWLWQYSESATVPGINPPTDVNHYDGPVSRLLDEWAGRDIVTPVPPAQQVVSVIISAPAGVKVEVQVIEDDNGG